MKRWSVRRQCRARTLKEAKFSRERRWHKQGRGSRKKLTFFLDWLTLRMKVQCFFFRKVTISSQYSVISYKTPNPISIPVRTTKLRVLQFVRAPLSEDMKVKQSHDRPGLVLGVPGGWESQISRQSAHECSKVVSHTHRPPLPPRKYSRYSFLLEAESTPGP